MKELLENKTHVMCQGSPLGLHPCPCFRNHDRALPYCLPKTWGGGGQPAQGELFLLIIKPQLTTPDPVDPRRSEIAISTPAGPRTGPGDTDKHERIQEIVIRGIWGLLILPNKVLLFCVRRDYPRKLNDLNIYPGLFSVKL